MFEMGAKFDDGWGSDNKEKKVHSSVCKLPKEHRLVFAKEKRKGKVVTIVKPFYLEKRALQELLKHLKKELATGGSLKENSLEFQGDIKDKLSSRLKELDFSLKVS